MRSPCDPAARLPARLDIHALCPARNSYQFAAGEPPFVHEGTLEDIAYRVFQLQEIKPPKVNEEWGELVAIGCITMDAVLMMFFCFLFFCSRAWFAHTFLHSDASSRPSRCSDNPR